MLFYDACHSPANEGNHRPIEIVLSGHFVPGFAPKGHAPTGLAPRGSARGVSASAGTLQRWSAKADHWPQAQKGDFQSPPEYNPNYIPFR